MAHLASPTRVTFLLHVVTHAVGWINRAAFGSSAGQQASTLVEPLGTTTCGSTRHSYVQSTTRTAYDWGNALRCGDGYRLRRLWIDNKVDPAAIGRAATFSVTASGTAPLIYQWYRNGSAIGGANSASFTTPVVTAADNNTSYSVTISNAAGSITSSTATLLTASPIIHAWQIAILCWCQHKMRDTHPPMKASLSSLRSSEGRSVLFSSDPQGSQG